MMGLMFPKKPVGRVRGLGGRYENKLHTKEMRDEMSNEQWLAEWARRCRDFPDLPPRRLMPQRPQS